MNNEDFKPAPPISECGWHETAFRSLLLPIQEYFEAALERFLGRLLGPILEPLFRMEGKIDVLDDRSIRIEKTVKAQRKDPSASDRQTVIRIDHEYYGGKCPSCHQVQIVGPDGEPLPGCDIDHRHHRSMAVINQIWPNCHACNIKSANDRQFYLSQERAFIVFQETLRADEERKNPKLPFAA